uniref:Uncharacterized protein n=1 Tax=Picea sitchensis TaxID=3332 RepID=B8LNL6_PICSI|nr:unknown [Picea sitchensis]
MLERDWKLWDSLNHRGISGNQVLYLILLLLYLSSRCCICCVLELLV